MDTFIIGYVLGLCTVIAAGIFIWAIRRGKADSSGTLEKRTDRNNSDIRSGFDKLREINREATELNEQSADINRRSGDLNREAKDTARKGLKAIDNTRRSVSEIIASAKRTGKKKSEG